jgi:hypothetical protein
MLVISMLVHVMSPCSYRVHVYVHVHVRVRVHVHAHVHFNFYFHFLVHTFFIIYAAVRYKQKTN